MYVPTRHQLTDREDIFALVESHPLATWVCQGAGGLVTNHIPLFLERNRGEFGTLIGHVSRANPVWRELEESTASVVIFHGPQTYISPGWYPGKVEHGKVVPTWNYAVAHAHGIARAVHDRGWLLDMLDRLTNAQEARQPTPWRTGDAPAPYIDRMLNGIVGIEIPIDRLEGKLKASQDEDLQDRLGTVSALREDPRQEARQMANLVMKAIDDETPGR
ncbi:FMN-binding negative transcriptional regulator [Hydrogenophaga sp.]|uniref:FMN-binding negative transcriptional regulator n=1 Tax=Hydrogenophaga sp. TaxID=1904254 RepID=UPI0025BC000A|nr:FMN-binding negative transcriptional regulator [Hydrogenophaga sp.]MBT9466675.1 FMN-binding negative transcriptional regulator [Hydrogenophaga sp.]